MSAFQNALQFARSLAKGAVEQIMRFFRARKATSDLKLVYGENEGADAERSRNDEPPDDSEDDELITNGDATSALPVGVISSEIDPDGYLAPPIRGSDEIPANADSTNSSDLAKPDDFGGASFLPADASRSMLDSPSTAVASEPPFEAISQLTGPDQDDQIGSATNETSRTNTFPPDRPEPWVALENGSGEDSSIESAAPSERAFAGEAAEHVDKQIPATTPEDPLSERSPASASSVEAIAEVSGLLGSGGSSRIDALAVPQPRLKPGTPGHKREKSDLPPKSEPSQPDQIQEGKEDEKIVGESGAFAGGVRAPRQYKPTGHGSPQRSGKRPLSTKRPNLSVSRALPIAIRIQFERGSFSKVSFLPRKTAGLPDEIRVSGSAGTAEFSVLQDGWYQDVFLTDSGRLLREGIEWDGAFGDGQREKWSLSGREIYVLAEHKDLAAFVSTPRLVLGEDHVVLCTCERLSEVTGAVAAAESPIPTVLNESTGVPRGWVALRGVVPHKPVPHSTEGGDLFDALRPLPEANVVLVGGIRIERQTWLAGYPPRIRLRGDPSVVGDVIIDGVRSTPDTTGTYTAPGWDDRGPHLVWCSSGSCSYSIRDGADAWDQWAAHTWPLGHSAICGSSIFHRHEGVADGRSMVLVPSSNPVLLGSTPGQIHSCRVRSDIFAQFCAGFPAFEPVWALPELLWRADKSVNSILFVGQRGLPSSKVSPSPHRPRRRRARTLVDDWCSMVLNASRKHLRVKPVEPILDLLWAAYRVKANSIRKMRL